ncbi:MAG: phosphoribosylformylglycinamidine synthase subunit PurL [Acidobacteriota bacterium]|nr:phosphoribosylformylglycinamidine synthase subunit PurL [Acidobacteriota bacterium]
MNDDHPAPDTRRLYHRMSSGIVSLFEEIKISARLWLGQDFRYNLAFRAIITKSAEDMSDLTPEEYARIVERLGRDPNPVELGMLAAMWSEHCSYKSSKVHLRRLPTSGPRVLQGPGENAGVVDIGDGWCIVFKIESHNHPSFIEPYQGAATGVGGILRDIFTMGARPIAVLDSLRFGPLTDPRNRAIMDGVVRGIADYGNCFGVPTVGGEVFFAECYARNPLVNAMAVGLARREQIFYARASGPGNTVLYVGAKTGRDGIHGARMASAEFTESALEQRPAVQVGDPFMEKLLLEACLEALRTNAIVGLQDMGAAGLTCASCEMGARAHTGIELDLDRVPQREAGMSAYEILLSESQERMLLVVRAGHEREVKEIFAKWGLDAVEIGRVTDDGRLRVFHRGHLVADLPNRLLAEEAPVYHRPMKPVTTGDEVEWDRVHAEPAPLEEVLRQMLRSPNLASKQWVYRQYDHMVRTNTILLPGADAAVLRIKETRKAIALTLDGNGRYCHLNPRAGARLAVAEACRNLVVTGALPIACTNCLNFASPERPEVMWAFSEVIDGMAEACAVFETPVTGGNVSFYNETEGRGVYPTPVIGMLGLIEGVNYFPANHGDVERRNRPSLPITPWFKTEGDLIVLLGRTGDDLGGSEYLAWIHGLVGGGVPRLDLQLERAVQRACLRAIAEGIIKSAHDCSDGGLAIALVECCFSSHRREAIGADLVLTTEGVRSPISLLFSETPSRILVTLEPEHLPTLERIAGEFRIPYAVLGRVGGSHFRVTIDGNMVISIPVHELEAIWQNVLPEYLGP